MRWFMHACMHGGRFIRRIRRMHAHGHGISISMDANATSRSTYVLVRGSQGGFCARLQQPAGTQRPLHTTRTVLARSACRLRLRTPPRCDRVVTDRSTQRMPTRLSRLGKDRACSTAPHPHTCAPLSLPSCVQTASYSLCVSKKKKPASDGLYVDWRVAAVASHYCTCVVRLQLQGARARARARRTVMFVGRCGWLPISTVRSRELTDNPKAGRPAGALTRTLAVLPVQKLRSSRLNTLSLLCNDTFLGAKMNIVGPRMYSYLFILLVFSVSITITQSILNCKSF